MGQNELLYTVGEVAKRLNVKAATLRYYDDEGIVKPSCVSEAGYRLYTERDIERLELVLAMRQTGLSLGDIRQALTNRDNTRTLLVQQLMLIEKQMEQLQRAKVLLETALDAIQDNSNVDLLTALRELPGVLSLSNAQQQDFILEKIQWMMTTLFPERDRMTEDEVQKLRAFLFGQMETTESDGEQDPETSKRQAAAVLYTERLAAEPAALASFKRHVAELVDRMKNATPPEDPSSIQRTIIDFRNRISELAAKGARPDSAEVQACLNEYFTTTARGVGMTLEEFRQWAFSLETDLANTSLPQALSTMLKLNPERTNKDVEAKQILKEAIEVWKRRQSVTPT